MVFQRSFWRLLMASILGLKVATAADLFDLSLEQLLQVPVTSASRSAVPLQQAPATVIVLSRAEITTRGYRDLSEILNDLPGMEPIGITAYSFQNYWRGLRKTVSSPYLVLRDGLEFNSLYRNDAKILTTFPINQVDRIEIVYGPASVVYGANAFAGVINVITRQAAENGHSVQAQLAGGSFADRRADLFWQYRDQDRRVSLAARFDQGDLDRDSGERYEYTRERYLADPALWGDFVNDEKRGGRYRAPQQHAAIDFRLAQGDSEFALQYFSLSTGYGNALAADRAQPLSYWREPELSVYAKQKFTLSEALAHTVLLRYRESRVADDSSLLESVVRTDAVTGLRTRFIRYNYWEAESVSIGVLDDWHWRGEHALSADFGFRVERKDLQKAYRNTRSAEWLPQDVVNYHQFPLPPSPDEDSIANNRLNSDEVSGYGLLHFEWQNALGIFGSHRLEVGARVDRQPQTGSEPSLRTGYVLHRNEWTSKLLYGEAFNAPAPRELYGGWTGSGSSPDLQAETGATLEASLQYTQPRWSLLGSRYRLSSDNNITTFGGGAVNLGQRKVDGLDLHFNWHPTTTMRLWSYYSWMKARESRPDSNNELHYGVIGDSAEHKIYLGSSWQWRDDVTLTARARWLGPRQTVPTNPIGEVDAYSTFDLSAQWRLPTQLPLSLSLTVLNASDEHYFHPGFREANAGTQPGYFDADGQWTGSAGLYNSLLPQEGRGIFLSLTMDWRSAGE